MSNKYGTIPTDLPYKERKNPEMIPIVAIMYDFDKTLSPRDMQEYAFVPEIGMTGSEFWAKCNQIMFDNDMDGILAYMYFMVEQSKKHNLHLSREEFRHQGENVVLFDGVCEWFDRITEYGKAHGVSIEHYVISSGLKEIIEGTPIARYFTKIYAAEFLYDKNGEAIWPAMAVNYTSKTQFVYRINKGVLDVTAHDDLNESTPDEQKRISFQNMIYIGDGLSDVPCMKLVKSNGGHSVAVYQEKKEQAVNLLKKGRVSYIAHTDYREGSKLDTTVNAIIDQIKAMNVTREIYKKDIAEN